MAGKFLCDRGGESCLFCSGLQDKADALRCEAGGLYGVALVDGSEDGSCCYLGFQGEPRLPVDAGSACGWQGAEDSREGNTKGLKEKWGQHGKQGRHLKQNPLHLDREKPCAGRRLYVDVATRKGKAGGQWLLRNRSGDDWESLPGLCEGRHGAVI